MVQKQALTGGLREGPWGGSLFYWAGALHRSRVNRGYALLRYPPTTKPPEDYCGGNRHYFNSAENPRIGAEEKETKQFVVVLITKKIELYPQR
ncbi:hypothetical protein KUCAC02_018146 [Chaenocephalus aceratus]|uniref:Uncharacterized protein n=1 Tax=Chaenocephalus aceratus TaxID=36190 RepID=A0ACB9W8U7_CHAAC|nr:hypothetical protein KUCAC02_018146 [Chaenocephalus aceratus]